MVWLQALMPLKISGMIVMHGRNSCSMQRLIFAVFLNVGR
jgi:hypothetical protein